MIRIIFISLLTLTLSCGNMRPEPAAAPVETSAAKAAPEATPAPRTETTPSSKPETTVSTATTTTTATTKKATTHPEKKAAKSAIAVIAVSENKTAAEAIDTETSPAVAATATTAPIYAEIEVASPAATISSSETTNITATSALVPTTAPSDTALAIQKADKPVLVSRKHFLPTRQRIDREVNKLKFAYKGEVMLGLTASYGTLSSDDTDFLSIIKDITADATIATVKPFLGYFYSDNHAVGVRFGYNHIGGTLKTAAFDLGPSNDITGNIPYIHFNSDNYAFGVFHRSYAGLDPKGRFGLFAEFELSVSTGSSEFTYEQNNVPKSSFNDNMQVKLSFNPGAAVYIFPNVCATLSFGLGGIQYTSVTQKDENGKKIGTRKASKMNFKLNIAAINIGMNVHLWDKKKK